MLFRSCRLQSMGGPCLEERVRSLASGVDRFAAWRWKTLANVARDLARIKDAFCAAVASVGPGELGSHDGQLSSTVWRAAGDHEFWAQASSLQDMVKPLSMFSAWLRGCPCHEAARLAGRNVSCPWQGCRAPELASRTQKALEDLCAVRSKYVASHDICLSVSSIVSSLQVKMQWVFELPYLVW